MASLNRVLIIGNLGADPELRHTASGQAVTNMRVATTHHHTDRDGQTQETTEWHTVVVWGKTAENCAQYLAKGRAVFVEGRLATRSWEDQNGEKKYATEIVASTVQFLGGSHLTAVEGGASDAQRPAAPARPAKAGAPAARDVTPHGGKPAARPATPSAMRAKGGRAVGAEIEEDLPF